MSQYYSRIYIKVTEPSIWEKFKDTDDAEFDLVKLAKTDKISFAHDDLCLTETETEAIVCAVAKTLGKDGVIIADTTNINVDPYAFIVYSAGYGVHTKFRRNTEYCSETSMSDPIGCLNYKNYFTFTPKEIKVLSRVGIEQAKLGKKLVFRYCIKNEGLEDEIFLTETRFEGRTERMESIKKGEPVRLVHDSSDKTYRNKVEVFAESGSLGLLDGASADIMAPILDAGRDDFTALVHNVIPLSARSLRCHAAIISIHIQFEVEPIEIDDEPEEQVKSSSKTVGASDTGIFSYEHIDNVGVAFYEGIWDGKSFATPKDETVAVTVDGKTVDVRMETKRRMNAIGKKFAKALCEEVLEEPVYDPISAVNGNLEESGGSEYKYMVSDGADELEPGQIAHRAKLFGKVISLLSNEKVLAKIVESVPKKKNGLLHVRRVTQVATLFCMRKQATMYVLCAVAKSDNELLLEIREVETSDLSKAEADVITQNNLFRDLL